MSSSVKVFVCVPSRALSLILEMGQAFFMLAIRVSIIDLPLPYLAVNHVSWCCGSMTIGRDVVCGSVSS